jgi:predicted metal-dependent phosphoesterase TrpH
MQCDLHVHTRASGMCNVPWLRSMCRESYNEPLEVYRTLKARGMDLVTVTDHDSIGSVECLGSMPDFFLGEEVSCRMPSGTRIHVGVYGLKERHQAPIERRSYDLIRLVHYFSEQRLFFSINHAFSALTGRRAAVDFDLFAEHFPGVETRNGHMPARSNALAAKLAAEHRKAPVGGSDSHTYTTLGSTYTEVPGARNPREFLAGLRQGSGIVHGAQGSYWKLTQVVYEIGLNLMRERGWARRLFPLSLAVPGVTAVIFAREMANTARWGVDPPFPGSLSGQAEHYR